MPRATLYHFSCGHSMNQRDKDDVCPLCGSGILTGQQPVQIIPEDALKSFRLEISDEKVKRSCDWLKGLGVDIEKLRRAL